MVDLCYLKEEIYKFQPFKTTNSVSTLLMAHHSRLSKNIWDQKLLKLNANRCIPREFRRLSFKRGYLHWLIYWNNAPTSGQLVEMNSTYHCIIHMFQSVTLWCQSQIFRVRMSWVIASIIWKTRNKLGNQLIRLAKKALLWQPKYHQSQVPSKNSI